MPTTEKVVLILCLFAGFFWLRRRSRSVPAEGNAGKALLGVFVLLPAALIGEKFLFEKFPFGPWTNLLLKAAIVLLTFAAVGFLFLKKPEAAKE